MRRLIIRIMGVVIMCLSTSVFAGEYPEYVNNACKNYLAALRLDNEGVVESAIFNVMKLKLVYHDLEYSQVTAVLDSIAENADKQVLQRKAYVAAMYLKYPERFNWITNGTYQQNNAFFDLLAVKLEQQGEKIPGSYASSDSSR